MDRIRLRGPADVLVALPYQLGYHPRDSVVVVALHGGRVGMVARLDLPEPGQVAATAAVALAPLLRERPDRVLLVGYESQAQACRPLLDEVSARIGDTGLPVVERLVVRDDRWFSLGAGGADGPRAGQREGSQCDEQPEPEGEPLPDPSQTPAVAEFVAMGVAPLRDRAALVALVAADAQVSRGVATALRRHRSHAGAAFGLPPAPPAPITPAASVREEAVRRLRSLAVWRAVCDVGADSAPVDRLSFADVAELVVSLEDVGLRDGLIGWLCPGTLPLDVLPGDLADQLRSSLPTPAWHGVPRRHEAIVAGRRLLVRLQWLARAVPDADAAPVLTVLAHVAWWLGDGTAARVALDRALQNAPDYRLAGLLDRMVGLGLRMRERDGVDPAVTR